MKIKLKTLALTFMLVLSVSLAYPQVGIPGNTVGNDDVNDEAPISSLVFLGLAVGAVFGVKKLK